MGWFDILKKKETTDALEQGKTPEEIASQNNAVRPKDDESSENAQKPKIFGVPEIQSISERRERFNRILMQMHSILERIDLLEKKVNRLEIKTGIKHETEAAK